MGHAEQLGKVKVPNPSVSDQEDGSSFVRREDECDLQLDDVVETKFGIGSIIHRDTKFFDQTPYSSSLKTVSWTGEKYTYHVEEIELLASRSIGRIGVVQLTQADLWRLGPGRYLNDNCIDAMLHTLVSKLKPSISSRVHVFNSFFDTQLRNKNIDPSKIVNMTKGKGIEVLSKDFLFVPINRTHHWSLAVACNLKQLKVQIEKKRRQTAEQGNEASTGQSGKEKPDDGDDVVEVQGGGCTDKPTERDEDEEDCRILKKNESNDETHDTEADVVEIDADDNPEKKLPEMLVGRLFNPSCDSALFCVTLPSTTRPGDKVSFRLMLNANNVHDGNTESNCNANCERGRSSSVEHHHLRHKTRRL